jgi:hypothetical protein
MARHRRQKNRKPSQPNKQPVPGKRCPAPFAAATGQRTSNAEPYYARPRDYNAPGNPERRRVPFEILGRGHRWPDAKGPDRDLLAKIVRTEIGKMADKHLRTPMERTPMTAFGTPSATCAAPSTTLSSRFEHSEVPIHRAELESVREYLITALRTLEIGSRE